MPDQEERRRHERYPTFTSAEIVVEDSNGDRKEHSIMLRDKSSSGIGCVYIGQDPLHSDDLFYLKGSSGELTALRLAWRKEVARYVTVLGFEIVSE